MTFKHGLMIMVVVGLLAPTHTYAQISQTGAASNSGDTKEGQAEREDVMDTALGKALKGLFAEIVEDAVSEAELEQPELGQPETEEREVSQSIVPVESVVEKIVEDKEAVQLPAQKAAEPEIADVSPSIIQAIKAQKNVLSKAALKHFYSTHGSDAYWSTERGLNANSEHFIEVLKQSWAHGLNPQNYHLEQIEELTAQGDYHKYDVMVAQLDVMLTDAFARYVRDLSGMRINASAVRMDSKHWRQLISAKEALMVLPADQLGSDDFERVLASASPQSATYNNLRRKLRSLLDEYNSSDGSAQQQLSINLSGRVLKPGWSHREIPELRAFLGSSLPDGEGLMNYDPALEAAVKGFQKTNGLKPDGLVGPQTLQVMNKTLKQKIYQVVANLERMRWVERNKPERYVVVNIPSGMLWAIDNGAVKVEMPVIVGRVKRETPSFVTTISGMRLNPTWTIPPTIKKKDIWPKMMKDPNYLANRGIELTRVSADGGGREVVDSTSVDWFNTSWNDLNRMRMVQTPGRANPLGLYRVLMPNRHNIYLHDTDQKHYFERSDHAISSGCIRMKEPEKMAEFIFESKANWSKSRTESLVEARIPVYLLYYTAWSDDNGDIVLGRDIYDYDGTLIQELKKKDAFLIPFSKS
jgi:murein L,D-transpeptidase YcbB/YkuD